MLGFGDAGSREEALEMDDAWVEQVWGGAMRDVVELKERGGTEGAVASGTVH
jgi:hypothetical protein